MVAGIGIRGLDFERLWVVGRLGVKAGGGDGGYGEDAGFVDWGGGERVGCGDAEEAEDG